MSGPITSFQDAAEQALTLAETFRTRAENAEAVLGRLVRAVDSENFNRPARAPEMSQALRVALREARAAVPSQDSEQ